MATDRYPDYAAALGREAPAVALRLPEEEPPKGGRAGKREARRGGGGRTDSQVDRPVASGAGRPRLDAVLAAMADAVLVYDADGHIAEAHGALADALGLDTDAARIYRV